MDDKEKMLIAHGRRFGYMPLINLLQGLERLEKNTNTPKDKINDKQK